MQGAGVFEQCWSARIPIRLTLNPHNITSPAPVHPLYVLAPRHSYLATLGSLAWAQMQHVLPNLPGQNSAKPWFDFQGLPLKGVFPIGVLFDLTNLSTTEPWSLTVHFTHPPDVLIGWDNGQAMQLLLLNSMKEACYICRGTEGAASVMRLGGQARDDLWAAVEKNDVVAYKATLAAIKVVPSERQGQPPGIPVRIFVRQKAHEGLLSLWDNTWASSRPIAAHPPGASSQYTTLGQALHTLLPKLFPPAPSPGNTSSTLAGAGGAASTAAQAAAPSATSTSQSVTSAPSAAPIPVSTSASAIDSAPDTTIHPAGIPAEPHAHAPSESQGQTHTFASTALHFVEPAHQPPQPADTSSSIPAALVPPPHTSSGPNLPQSSELSTGDATAAGQLPVGSSQSAQSHDTASTTSSQLPGTTSSPVDSSSSSSTPGSVLNNPITSNVLQQSSADVAALQHVMQQSLHLDASTHDHASSHQGVSSGSSTGATTAAQGAASQHALSSSSTIPASAAHGLAHAMQHRVAQHAELSGQQHGRPAARVLIHGISPPLETPLAWLHAAFHAPDMFLYIVVHSDS